MEALSGVLNLSKASGPTSHDVIAKLRKILNIKRIGHTGTLDPGARGVLVVCIGQATRLAQYLEPLPKSYEAELILGATTTTEDASGEVLESRPVAVTEAEVKAALEQFVGSYMQVPPMYSALRHQGKRLYELARAGQEVERQPRQVEIYRLELLSFTSPVATIAVDCSKGTYIRTLCKDVGEVLGTGGHMGALVRTASGHFSLESAVTLEEVLSAKEEGTLDQLMVTPAAALRHLPKVVLDPEELRVIGHGGKILGEKEGLVMLVDGEGQLKALAQGEDGVLRPVRVFN